MSCPFQDVFGAPGSGVHKIRLADVAVVDVGLTVVMAAALSRAFGWPLGQTTLGCFLLGVLLHRLFCVRTTVDKMLFAP